MEFSQFGVSDKEKLNSRRICHQIKAKQFYCFCLKQEPQLIKLDPPGPLTLAMHQFLTEMQETKKGVVTPKELFAQVCKK